MKRTITLLCCLLMLCLMLPASGLAQTQDEWDLSCSSKTLNSATIYDFSVLEEGEAIGTIPAGAYVHVRGTGSGDWKRISYMVNGVKGQGWAEVKTVNCTSHVRMSDGYQHKIHEKDPQYEQKVQMGVLELEYDKTPVQTDATTATIASSTPAASSNASNDTSSASNDSSDNNATSATHSTNESARGDEATDSATVAEAAEPTTDEGTSVRIVELGTYQTVVELNGEDQTVLTADLTFSESVPEEQKVAVIHTPKTGKATMRASASKKGDHLKTCKAGTVVSVLEVGDDFTLISDDGRVGYVLNSCLSFHAPVTEPEGTAALSYKGKTNGSTTVNIRNQPDKHSAKAATWKTGTELVVLGFADGWYEVEANGVRGFVMEEYITLSE